MKTAVEWLIEMTSKLGYVSADIAEQAKEMEKENLESLKDFDTWKEWKNKSEEDK